MQERDPQVDSGRNPSVSSYSPQAPQNQESGWKMALKTVFWLLLLPSAVLLVIRWLMPA